ncbi:MAG TPA: hypothetical protein VK154_11405, partial [Chitinophagales bacterium]|nr:hypothetical protein [Chitinophagales bacterium]
NTARTLFVAGNYSEALDWVNRILNEKMTDAREDLNAAARILYLLIHYELGNDILLESIITSTKNSLKYKRRLFKAEQIILTHLARLNGARKGKDRGVIFTSLTQNLQAIFNDSGEVRTSTMDDISGWITSKITGKPIGKIIADSYLAEYKK